MAATPRHHLESRAIVAAKACSRLRAGAADPTVLALAGILLLGLLLRVVFWYGLVNVDPYTYADSAASLARWQPVFDPEVVGSIYYTQYIRLSLVVPAALLYRVFGPGEVVSTLVPVAASLGVGLVAFELARQVGGKRAGLFAAFLAVVFPLSVINSTQFLPDTMLVFFAGLTMLLFIKAFEGERSSRARWYLYAGAGASWALAFYARPTALALAPPFVVLVLLRRRFHVEFVGGALGGLAVLALAQVLLMSLGSGFLEDVRTVITEGRGYQPGALRYSDIDWSYLRYLIRDPMFLPSTLVCLIGTGLAFIYMGLRRFATSSALALVVLAVGQYLYFEFLMRFPNLYSWWKEPRYALSMLIPLFSLAGVGLSSWLGSIAPRYRRATGLYVAGALAFVLVLSIYVVRNDHAYWESNRIDSLAAEVAGVLAEQPPGVIFTWNDDFARDLSFHVGLDRTTALERTENRGAVRNRFDSGGRSLVEPGGYVIVHQGQEGLGLPTAVPDHWRPVWSKPGLLAIYRVPGVEALPATLRQPEQGLGDITPGVVLYFFGAPAKAFPRQHVAVELELAGRLSSDLPVEVASSCAPEVPRSPGASDRVFARTIPAGALRASFDLPLDAASDNLSCRLFVRAAQGGGDWIAGPIVRIPVLRVVEPEDAYTFDPALERGRQSGWFRTAQPFFSAGGAAVAVEPYADLAPPIANLPAGNYVLHAAVYDYARGENSVAVTLNGVAGELRWGGAPSPGVVQLTLEFRDVPAGGEFRLRPQIRGQDGITIDRLVLVGE